MLNKICRKAICQKKDVFNNLNKNASYCQNVVNAANVVLTTPMTDSTKGTDERRFVTEGSTEGLPAEGRRCFQHFVIVWIKLLNLSTIWCFFDSFFDTLPYDKLTPTDCYFFFITRSAKKFCKEWRSEQRTLSVNSFYFRKTFIGKNYKTFNHFNHYLFWVHQTVHITAIFHFCGVFVFSTCNWKYNQPYNGFCNPQIIQINQERCKKKRNKKPITLKQKKESL